MIHFIENHQLIEFANHHLDGSGVLSQKEDGYVYLKISDDYIHKLFQFVSEPEKEMPDYFSASKGAGAHISVIYPWELAVIPRLEGIGRQFDFKIERYFKAILDTKAYFGCTVQAPELIGLRLSVELGEKLSFRDYSLPLHFTIAVRNITAST